MYDINKVTNCNSVDDAKVRCCRVDKTCFEIETLHRLYSQNDVLSGRVHFLNFSVKTVTCQ
jgi:hypothetical protein